MLETRFMVNERQLAEAFKMLRKIPSGIEKASMRAANRAATNARAEWARAINADYTVKVTEVKKYMKQGKATRKIPLATVRIWNRHQKRLELAAFAHKPRKPIHLLTRKPRGGISVNVKRSTGYLKVPGAFKVIGRKSGKEHIVWRAREGGHPVGRYPLHILYGASPYEMAVPALEKIRGGAQSYFMLRFDHEVRHILRKYRKTWEGLSMDFTQDLAAIFEAEFCVQALLWPGQPGQKPINGHFNEPAHLAELGSEVGHLSLAPTYKCLSSDLEGFGYEDPIRILANPGLGIPEDRDFTAKRITPAGPGASLIELREA